VKWISSHSNSLENLQFYAMALHYMKLLSSKNGFPIDHPLDIAGNRNSKPLQLSGYRIVRL